MHAHDHGALLSQARALDVRDDLAPSPRRQSFFASTSCKMCLNHKRVYRLYGEDGSASGSSIVVGAPATTSCFAMTARRIC